jgi:hypothetical protein
MVSLVKKTQAAAGVRPTPAQHSDVRKASVAVITAKSGRL